MHYQPRIENDFSPFFWRTRKMFGRVFKISAHYNEVWEKEPTGSYHYAGTLDDEWLAEILKEGESE